MSAKKNGPGKVAVIILNWNRKDDTRDCLESLRNVLYENKEIIVVDNCSSDGSQEYIKEKFPEVTLIEAKENFGFTGGNNLGIKYAIEHDAEYVLLLNNDTVVDKNLISAHLEVFEKEQNVGLVGPKVVYYNNPTAIWCAGCNYNPIIGKWKMYGTYSKKRRTFEEIEEVDWISFCVVMIKVPVFKDIGFLDDEYFLSNEDLDFCIRAKKKNYLCYYTPKAVVKHKIAQSLGDLNHPLYVYYQVRNTFLFYKKNRFLLGYAVSLLYYILFSLPKRALLFFILGYPKRGIIFLYAFLDFQQGNLGKGKLSQNIIENIKKGKNKYRIGINIRYLQRQITGIERYVAEISNIVPSRDKDSEYYFFVMKYLPLPKVKNVPNGAMILTKFPTKQRWLRVLWELLYLPVELKENKINIFHGPAFFVPSWKPRGCKYVITVHDLAFIKYPNAFTRTTRVYYWLFFKRSLRLCDKIIAVSFATKDDLVKEYNVPDEKIVVIHSGITDKYKWEVTKEKSILIAKKYKLPKKYFIFVGSLSPRKNLLKILEALTLYSKESEKRETKLVVIGKKAWLYDAIFKYVKELNLQDKVLFLGYVNEDDMPSLYKNAEALLFPSLYEGFGFPVLEAMACGTPVITSNVSSLPEVAGDAAILVNPKNVEEIKEAMIKITTDNKLREWLIKKGKRQVKKFTWEEAAEKTIQVYHELGKKN